MSEAIFSIRSRTLDCSLKLGLNPDRVSGKIPRLFKTSRNLVKNNLSMTFRKISRREIGLVFDTEQIDSFFASRMIRTSFQYEGKKKDEKDLLNS